MCIRDRNTPSFHRTYLPHKTTKVVVLEIFWNDFRRESVRVFDNKGCAIVKPGGGMKVTALAMQRKAVQLSTYHDATALSDVLIIS